MAAEGQPVLDYAFASWFLPEILRLGDDDEGYNNYISDVSQYAEMDYTIDLAGVPENFSNVVINEFYNIA